MNETKKMLLVDPSALSRLQTPAPATQTFSGLDEAMSGVLNMSALSDRDKWRMYEQTLQKYLFKMGETRKPLELPLQADGPELVNSYDLSARIASEVPAKFTRKALALYGFMRTLPRVSWDAVGLVRLDNRPVPGSNLVDLVADLMRHRNNSQPPGIAQLLPILKEGNVSRELIGNGQRWQQIQAIGQHGGAGWDMDDEGEREALVGPMSRGVSKKLRAPQRTVLFPGWERLHLS